MSKGYPSVQEVAINRIFGYEPARLDRRTRTAIAARTSPRRTVLLSGKSPSRRNRSSSSWLMTHSVPCWNAEHAAGRITRPLRHNGEKYHGINIIVLWMVAETQGFNCPFWLTFQQAKQLGGFVKKGEHGSPVVYASTYKKNDTDESGEKVERDCRCLKQFTVFNACQVEGLPEHYYALAEPPKETMQRIEQADRFFANTNADIRNGGNRAYYNLTDDFIRMPPFETFRDAESHAATLAHELTHWTRHASRLNRDFGRKRFGDEGYAMEELVAELASAFLCADLQITPELRDDHASYLDHWLKVLKDDKRAIFTAASHASQAVGCLHRLQPC